MNGTHVNSENCKSVLDQLDCALDIWRAAETDPRIARHLENCPECSQELQARLAVRDRLRATVRGFSVTPEIERRLSDHLSAARTPSWMRKATLIAAALVLSAGTAITYRLGHLRLTPGAQESYISAISQQVSGIMRVGLGDHVHCAVFHGIEKNPPADTTMPSQYQDLIVLVKDKVPAGYRVVVAHHCQYHGRAFVHLSATNGSGLISLVITRKAAGESFGKDQLAPILSRSGIPPLYGANVQRFEIAGFETRDHLVYVVSDLDGAKNLELMATIAPGVRDVLHRIEA